MAVSHSDRYLLGQDTGFRNRIRAGLINGALSVVAEQVTVTDHWKRAKKATEILNSPDTFYIRFADAVACDAAVINAATATGTVTLTAGNVAAQAALVTDAQINAALVATFNAFLVPFEA